MLSGLLVYFGIQPNVVITGHSHVVVHKASFMYVVVTRHSCGLYDNQVFKFCCLSCNKKWARAQSVRGGLQVGLNRLWGRSFIGLLGFGCALAGLSGLVTARELKISCVVFW